MLVSSKETKKIFLTTNSKLVQTLDTKVDIIISPEFYWIRKFEIPVKTEAQARHVLPTLFEDIVNDTTTLTYQVKKLKDNQYLCFAFNNKVVYEAIKKAMIPISNVSSLYFAQNECKEFNAFEVDNQKFMYTSDEILIKVPNQLLSETVDLNRVLNNIKLSNHKVQIKLYNDYIDTKFYYSIFTILGILIILNGVKYFAYNSEENTLEQNIEKTKKINKLPASSIQTKSILNRYKTVVESEDEKREAIDYILAYKKFNLKSFSLDKENISLEYIGADKKQVESYLKAKFKDISTSLNSLVLKVSIKL
ncbi:MAG: hypothetical protein ACNI25_09015 [Halarcobacter sp.]